MVCPNCGRSIDTKTRFCKNCGTDLKLFGIYKVSRNKIKLIIILLVIVAFIFVVLGVVFNMFLNNKKDVFMNDKNNVEKISTNSFESEIYIYTKDEGGRHTPFYSGFRVQFYFDSKEIKGEIILKDNVEKAYPGEKINANINLTGSIDIKIGDVFDIHEGGRLIGKGSILKIK